MLFGLPLAFFYLTAFVTGVLCVFTEWRQRHWRSAIPLAVCIVAFYVSTILARTTVHLLFVWALPSYEAVVHKIESGSITIPVSTEFQLVPHAEREARLAHAIIAKRDSKGVLTVVFWTEGSFVRHFGYMYKSSGVIEPDSKRENWQIERKVRSGWFLISG
jgi:ABC-type xylose transport system permease subunit